MGKVDTGAPEIKNKKRLTVVLIVLAAVFLFVMVWLGWIIIGRGEELQEKAQGQWTKNLSVSAKRGSILDKNGNILAQSANVDTVAVSIDQVKDAQVVASVLSGILDMEASDIVDSIKAGVEKERSQIWIKRQISTEQSDAIIMAQEQRSQQATGLTKAEQKEFETLDCVKLVTDTKRYYPNKDFLTQVLGYTTVDGEGQEGIELMYDKYLRGQDGRVITAKDAHGNDIPFSDEIYVSATDGYDIVLTVDEVLQSFLEKAVQSAYDDSRAKAAWGVAVNPQTGEILALVNIPDFDLNNVPRSDVAALSDLSRNRVVSDVYEPGSTFKIITTAAALDSGAESMESTFDCHGYYTVGDQRIKCWRSYNPHGHQTLTEAVMNSCNPAFMDMALSMGKEQFYEYIYNFGFGSKTGIDTVSESYGLVTDQKYVRDADLARIGFGQSIAVTPLQLVMGAAATVNGGYLYEPYIVAELRDTDGTTVEKYEPKVVRRVISEQTSAHMNEILEQVVSAGSGKNAAIPGYKIGGKTGTAQKYDENGGIAQGKVIASFLGYAATDDPQIMVLIAVDEPNVSVDFGSVVAAPYVKMFLSDAFLYLGIKPESTAETQTVTVPDVVGRSAEEAKNLLHLAGLSYEVDGSGTVVSQQPEAGTQVDKSAYVLVYTDAYDDANAATASDTDTASMVEVPDLSGMTVLEAVDKLTRAGLTIYITGAGTVTGQQPAAGSMAVYGSTVAVTFERAAPEEPETE